MYATSPQRQISTSIRNQNFCVGVAGPSAAIKSLSTVVEMLWCDCVALLFPIARPTFPFAEAALETPGSWAAGNKPAAAFPILRGADIRNDRATVSRAAAFPPTRL